MKTTSSIFILLAFLTGGIIGWLTHDAPPMRVSVHTIKDAVKQDTDGKVKMVGTLMQKDGVTIVRLSTPRGPEVAYLVADKYLAIGPLMDLKTGQNVTPIWEREIS